MNMLWTKFGQDNIILLDSQLGTIHMKPIEVDGEMVSGPFAIIPDNMGNRNITKLYDPRDAIFVSFSHYDLTDRKIKSAMTLQNLRRKREYESFIL